MSTEQLNFHDLLFQEQVKTHIKYHSIECTVSKGSINMKFVRLYVTAGALTVSQGLNVMSKILV